MSYFILECDGPFPTMPIRATEETRRLPGPWNHGRALSDLTRARITDVISYVQAAPLDREEPQHLKALYSAPAVPLMRDDLVAALRDAGVDSLELFPACITDPESGARATNYQAFNIVGLVACADASSSLLGTTPLRVGDTDFDGLVIDEARTGGALLFRVAENVSAIAVHDSVRRRIEEKGIAGMVFYGPGEWAG